MLWKVVSLLFALWIWSRKVSRDTVSEFLGPPFGFTCRTSSGACQGSCRLSYALLRFSVEGSRATLTTASRSGFKVTTAIGDQLRVGPDQRRGCLPLAS